MFIGKHDPVVEVLMIYFATTGDKIIIVVNNTRNIGGASRCVIALDHCTCLHELAKQNE